jgi:signal transduction histidine kinase
MLKTGRINGRPVMQSIEEYDKDKFFIDGVRGFTIIDRSKNELTRHCENQWIALRTNGLLIDEKNDFWVATNRGLAVYNLESNQMKFIRNRSDQFPGNRSIDLIEDSQGHYWVGTDAGLVIINPQDNSIKYLRKQEGLCNNDVMKLLLTENGHLWVATTDGVSIIDIANQKITNLGENEGLIPDEAYDLQEKEGTLYIGSVNGLIQITPPSDQNTPWNFYNYSAGQGFPSNDYRQDASLRLRNGQLWFGTAPTAKLTILTQDPVPDTIPCSVSITGLSIMDIDPSFESMASFQPYFETGDTLWSSDGNRIFTANTLPEDSGYVFENDIQWDSLSSLYKMPIGLKLPYNQNYLRFSYANQCVMNRDKISIRYMLAGTDDEWIYTGQDTESKNYFNLSPGAYTFRVATKGITGSWGDPAELSFHIIPPWWRTWWAYLGYALLAIGGVWAIVQYRSRRLQRENRLLEEKVSYRTKKLRESINTLKATQAQLVQSEKMASLGELTAGIAHEIQNPLNFVNNFSEVSKELVEEMLEEMKKGDDEEVNAIAADIIQNLGKILHHGKRADSIVKGMLQHSRSSSGETEPTNINALADEYLRLAYHGLRAKDKSFNATLKTDFDQSIGKIEVVPQDFGRVLLNLITNAFYAVQERSLQSEAVDYKPTVSVTTKQLSPAGGPDSYRERGGMVQITVSDNGSGIPDSIKQKIFQPFFTTKPTGQGTGLGLSLSYDIIKAHGGELKVETKEGDGTEFIIKLPVV